MCGIFGIYGHDEAANLTYLGLHALQHRGQESAGISSSDGKTLHHHRQMGLVADAFSAKVLSRLPGTMAIGHVRYSTAGVSQLKNAQPLTVRYAAGGLAIAHNGNLVNGQAVRDSLEQHGAIFQSDSDTEVIVHLIARGKEPSFDQNVVQALRQVKGAYSLLLLTERKLVAVRDSFGFRPLVLGRLKDAYVLASETTALDLIEAEMIRELEPGEMLVIDERGMRSSHPFEPTRLGRCVFEHVYFAKPDSVLFGMSVYAVRQKLGMQLAKESPADADLVVPVP